MGLCWRFACGSVFLTQYLLLTLKRLRPVSNVGANEFRRSEAIKGPYANERRASSMAGSSYTIETRPMILRQLRSLKMRDSQSSCNCYIAIIRDVDYQATVIWVTKVLLYSHYERCACWKNCYTSIRCYTSVLYSYYCGFPNFCIAISSGVDLKKTVIPLLIEKLVLAFGCAPIKQLYRYCLWKNYQIIVIQLLLKIKFS